MTSRGRKLVKMCDEKIIISKPEITSTETIPTLVTISDNNDLTRKGNDRSTVDNTNDLPYQKEKKSTFVMAEQHNSLLISDLNNKENNTKNDEHNENALDIISEKLEEDSFKILVCESAPASVNVDIMSTKIVSGPSSAPMPINHDISPISLNLMNDIISDEEIFSENTCIDDNNIIDSPVRTTSVISGVDILPQTDEEPFSDSESSWIPDTDSDQKEKVIKRKAKPNKQNKKNKKKKKEINSFTDSDDDTHKLIRQKEDDDNNIVNTNKNNECVIQSTELQNKATSSRQNLIIDETTDCESIEDNNENLSKKKKKLVRWKKSDPKNWRRNQELKNKRSGLPYKDRNGITRQAKRPKNSPCSYTCRFKCAESFSEEYRHKICQEYWQLEEFKQQKEFLLKRIRLKEVKTTLKNLAPEKQRKSSREYGFYKNVTEYIRVCKNFFMTTLCISTGPIETAINNVDESGSFLGKDRRGIHTPSHKTADPDIEEVKKHIESFPLIDSHYCRKSSSKQYLDATLSIAKMYELYVKKMQEINKNPVKLNVYKKIFGTQYNISFFHPKKDQCCLCNRFHRTQKPDETLKKEYEEHKIRKEAAYESKATDKKISEENENSLCVTMDLQSLLQIPATSDSLLYYCRKLNLYNLSVYEFKRPKNNGHCLIWTEVNGKKGSVEIASALNIWIKGIPETVTNLIIYSDTCSGQNRNQYIAAFLLHMVQTHPSLCVIEQKYLESGHSYMEVDSMHSAIEKEKRYSEVYSILDWKGIMSRARSVRNNKNIAPYKVTELSFKDMIDIKTLAAKIIKNRNYTEDNEKVNWLRIKCLRFEKQCPGIIKLRYDYEGPYKNLCTLKSGKATRSAPQMIDIAAVTLEQAYQQALPIPMAKKKDLLTLCRKNIIPVELHAWYEGLPASNQTIIHDLISEDETERE